MNKEIRIVVNHHNATAQIFTPYSEEFVPAMKALHGVWDRTQSCWWITTNNLPAAREKIRAVFGMQAIGTETELLSVRLRFSEDMGVFRKDVRLFGKVLSHATNRNSGGTAGEDVTYLAQRPESGGSIKNWCSIVPAGAVIRLDKVAREDFEMQKLPVFVTAEIINDAIPADLEVLRRERENLMARIAEIDRLLNA